MIIKPLVTGIMMASLAACGGGGSSSGGSTGPTNNTPPPAGPVGVTANGVITGFSSVIVDGVTYEVDGDTEVAIEDESVARGGDSGLRVGMRVRLRGTDDNGQRTADRIEYDDDLKGPARNVMPSTDDPAVGSFVVLGQTVLVDGNTVFDDDVGDNNSDGTIDIRDLTLGTGQVVVEVSGLLTDSGFLATRIERVNNGGRPDTNDDEFELKGFVDAVAQDGSSITINGTTILIQGNTIFEDNLTPDQTLVGVFVEVEVDEDASGTLLAVEIEREDDFGDRDGDGDFDDDDREGRFEIKGILGSVDVSVTPNVVVIGPTTLNVADASALVGLEGSLVELKGEFNDDGILVIAEAETERENTVQTEDRIASVDATSFTTRLGLVIEPSGTSRIEDDVDEDGDHLTPQEFIDRLQPGDYIEARGVPGSSGVTWTRLEREDEDDEECELQGPVTEITGDSSSFEFVIQGVTIDVSQVDDDDFESGTDDELGRQGFFDQLTVGAIVKAESDDAGLGCETGRLTADEVEFELDDGLVGTVRGNDDDPVSAREITGVPQNVTQNAFDLGNDSVVVVGSTRIDEDLIERALGREFDGDDQRFDQLPEGLTLADLLDGEIQIEVTVDDQNIALEIELED